MWQQTKVVLNPLGKQFAARSLGWKLTITQRWTLRDAHFAAVPGSCFTCSTDTVFVESFNARFREECLNAHWFWSLEDTEEKIDKWP